MLNPEYNEKSQRQECGDLYQKLDEADDNSILAVLPTEILCNIFKSCSLREQLVLAKVCTLFRQIIYDIFQRKFKFFNYNYLTFKYSLQLQDDEISELCYLCGEAVKRVRFNTFFDMKLLKDIECTSVRLNPMENFKYFINDNFKQNLIHFKNLEELEVQSKYLQDHTVLKLAQHCKKLKTLRMLDCDSLWLRGEYLHDLENIENLELRYCRNLEPNQLLLVSEERQLKSLNIVECQHMKSIPIIIKLCRHWQNLETLRLTAFCKNSRLLKSIINLPALKTLQFYWVNFKPLNFEEKILLELSLNQIKSLQLKHIKFENERYYIDNESLQEWSPEKYVEMRENVCINGRLWQWSTKLFDKIAVSLKNFKNLSTISFYYCRLVNYDQMKHLSLNNNNLELIKIYGCPRKADENFQRRWLLENPTPKCQLSFESLLSFKAVMNLYEKASSTQFSVFYRREPVMRSIECKF